MIHILDSIKHLLEAAKSVDADRVFEELKSRVPVYVSDYEEFEPFFGLGYDLPLEEQVLVLSSLDMLSIVAVLDVGKAGLAYRASSLLGYVPRFAILEWHIYRQINPNSIQMRDVCIMLGSGKHVENIGDMKFSVIRLLGAEVSPEVLNACINMPAVNKVPLLAAIAGLHKRQLLTRKPHEYGSEVHPLTRGYTHDIQ